MAFAVKIVKTAGVEHWAVYAWESTAGRSGNVLLDVEAKVFRPSDELGTPLGEMSVRVGEDIANPDPDTAQDFLTAVSGILKKWKGSATPPDIAHLYFG